MAVPQRTNFTNLQQLIGANQNNQLGNAIQSGVQKGITGLQSGVNQAQQQFQNDVNNNNLNNEQNQQFTQNTIGNIVNPPANSAAPQGQVASTSVASPLSSLAPQQTSTPAVELAPKPATKEPSALETPTMTSTPSVSSTTTNNTQSATNAAPGSFGAPQSNPTTGINTTPNTYTPSAGDISQFAKLMQGSYSGPSQLNNYNALLAQGQNLQGLGQNLNSQGGLQSLLQQFVGGNNYNRGEQGLDTLLLGQTGKPQLQNVAKSLQNVINIPKSAESQSEGLAQQTATGNQQFSQNLKNQLTSAQNPILQNIQKVIDEANTKNQGIQTNAQDVQNLLNNPNSSSLNRVGGGAAGATTDFNTAKASVKSALDQGLIDQDTFAQLNKLIPQMQAQGKNPKDLLAKSFNNTPTALPQYTLQQGANAQQAAQLNALQQLAGQAPQYSKYGGLTPVSAGFDLSKLPTAWNVLEGKNQPDQYAGNNGAGSWYGGQRYINGTSGPTITPTDYVNNYVTLPDGRTVAKNDYYSGKVT